MKNRQNPIEMLAKPCLVAENGYPEIKGKITKTKMKTWKTWKTMIQKISKIKGNFRNAS